ncbi:MAG: hypothetical protein V3V74_07165 [Nitrosomonadaceae bacterium]
MRYPNRRGFILLIVLALLSALTLMVLNLIETVQLERQLSQDYAHKVRSRLIARSGVQYAAATLGRNVYDRKDIQNLEVAVGNGTYVVDGDSFELSAQDGTGMININDGIAAGTAESATDIYSDSWQYVPNQLDPWPVESGTTIDETIPQVNKSGLINLRIRRILNAYGYAHKYKDKVDYEAGETTNMGSFEFTPNASANEGESAASGARGVSAPFDENALGDVIIAARESLAGYQDLSEIRNIVNAWAADNLRPQYVQDAGFDTFYEMVQGDLTCRSFQDENFYRLRTEIAATADLAVGGNFGTYPTGTGPEQTVGRNGTPILEGVHTSNKAFPCMWWYQNDYTKPIFHPNYLDIQPIDLTDDSGDLTFDTDGEEVKAERNMWLNHSVALINLNNASDITRAAIFYAPVNVSYLCEGAVTHAMRVPGEADNSGWGPLGGEEGLQPNLDSHNDYGLNWNALSERANARNSIGVRGPHFQRDRMTEGGNTGTGNVQNNRLMSLRDAMLLSEAYGEALEEDEEIYNFVDFKNYLTKYRKTERKKLGLTDLKKPVYERSEVIPLEESSTGVFHIKFVDNSEYEPEDCVLQYRDHDNDQKKLIRAIFMDEENPEDTEPLWVSQFWPVEKKLSNYRDNQSKWSWEGGWFLEDYIERTLPHIFSCVRRIPGYLGAPMALTSPYMVIEPYDFIDPNSAETVPWYRPEVYRRDQDHMGKKSVLSDWDMTSNSATGKALREYMGRLPKISVEDFVTRHTLPKVCFLSNGYFNVESVGYVKSLNDRVVSKTTIKTMMRAFETKYYRTQADFVGLLNRNDSDEIWISDDPKQGQETHAGMILGPEFKFDNTDAPYSGGEITLDQRVHSKYLSTIGVADANSTSNPRTNNKPVTGLPSGNGEVEAWDIFMEGDPRDENGGLNQSPNVPTILPSYGSEAWQAMTMRDLRPSGPGGSNLFVIGKQHSYLTGASDVWYGAAFSASDNLSGLNGDGNLPWPSTNFGYVGSSFENISGMFSEEEFARKWQSRMFIPRGSNLEQEGQDKENGRMEGARDHLWAQKDGHDNNVFGTGIFFGAGGNGEYADKYMNPYDRAATTTKNKIYYPYVSDPNYDGTHSPATYRDTMYWNLNNKLKNFSVASKDTNGDMVCDLTDNDAGGIDGLMDTYDLPYTWSVFDGDNGDTNPVGLGFHRGFMGAWFRIPTAYPFAHDTGHQYQNHTKQFKCIMNLHLLNMVSSDGEDNDLKVIPKGRDFVEVSTPLHKDATFPTPHTPDYRPPEPFYKLNDGSRNNFGMRFTKFYPTSIGQFAYGKNQSVKHGKDDFDSPFPGGGQGGTSKRVPPYTMHHEVDIMLGYYSGFDTTDFSFDHGVVGYYLPSFVWGGVGVRGLSSTYHYGSGYTHPNMLAGLKSARDGWEWEKPPANHDLSEPYDAYGPHMGHPIEPVGDITTRKNTEQVIGAIPRSGNPYYNKVHGHMFDYAHMLPTPFSFRGWSSNERNGVIVRGYNHTHEDGISVFSPHDNPTPLKGGNNEIPGEGIDYEAPSWLAGANTEEMGMPVQFATNTTRLIRDADPSNAEKTWVKPGNSYVKHDLKYMRYGPTNCRNVPFHNILWEQLEEGSNSRNIKDFMAYRDYEMTDELPVDHIMYSSHADYQLYNTQKVTIEHQLSMNTSAECAPGSWHRVYAFWFMRYNPGEMSEPGTLFSNAPQGDSKSACTASINERPPYLDPLNGSFQTPTESRYTQATEPANDVDGLDQFGIWFRDDSNYTDLFDAVGSTGGGDKSLIKPRFRVYRQVMDGVNTWSERVKKDEYINDTFPWPGRKGQDGKQDRGPVAADAPPGTLGDLLWEEPRIFHGLDKNYNFGNVHPNIHLSIGSVHTGLDAHKDDYRFTGEGRHDHLGKHSADYYYDYDLLRRRYPAHVFNSTIDDIIFGYGPDISNKGTFDGLYHNAAWLADDTLDVNDEVRYDIDPTDSKKQPQIIFDLLNDPSVGGSASLVHVGTRIYHPRDSGNDPDSDGIPERYNYSELRLDIVNDEGKMVDIDPSQHSEVYDKSSVNNQDHFFNDLSVSKDKPVTIQLKYTGYQRRHDDTYETVATNKVITDSVYLNYGQGSVSSSYQFDDGDSFTNLSHIQELAIRYRNGGVKYYNWEE